MKYIDEASLARLSQALSHEGPECAVHTRIEAYSCKHINRDKKLLRALDHAHADEHLHPAARKTLHLLIATLNIAFPDHDFSDVRPFHFLKEQSGASVLNALSTTLLASRAGAGFPKPRSYSSYPPAGPGIFPSSVPTSSSPTYRYPSMPSSPVLSGTHPTLYRILDDIIGLENADVYSYVPDLESDPYDDDEEADQSSTEEDDDDEDDGDLFPLDLDDSVAPRPSSPVRVRIRGNLLWSSHWFFFNRKLKRMLLISISARSKAHPRWSYEDEILEKPTGERFKAWDGAEGAGARAIGIKTTAARVAARFS